MGFECDSQSETWREINMEADADCDFTENCISFFEEETV